MFNKTVLALDYPPNRTNAPRYISAHARLDALISAGQERYAETLSTIKGYTDDLSTINVHETRAMQPSWVNDFLPGLDGSTIYALLRSRAPERYIEVGSGNSTKFAARARVDGDLATTMTSIDPYPRAEINALCDEVIREALESTDLAVWERVRPGDVVFFDGSHRVFMNGDVVAFFLDVLPSLPAGVLVGIHDIYLPYDYPAEIANRYYSEQYMLAAWLLGGADVDIVLPAHWVFTRMRAAVDDLWGSSPRFAEVQHHGVAFWFETR
jgi:hypothetical protein